MQQDILDIFWHPLANTQKVQDEDGNIIDTVNSWGFASMVSAAVAVDASNKQAEGVCIAACQKNGASEKQIRALIKRSRAMDWAAIRQLQTLIASGTDELVQESFEKK